MEVTRKRMGDVNGQDIFGLELTNRNQVKVGLSNFGATITAILAPDKNGGIANTVLGYGSPEEYGEDPFYIGCIVGRVAGRISKGRFSIDNETYELQKNDGKSGNHLHGGISGFNKKVFTIEAIECNDTTARVRMYYSSRDLEEGYPGNLEVWITFELNEDNELSIRYLAKTDKPTHVNLTNHSYFNLSGIKGNALGQTLFVNADKFLVADENLIPTGEIRKVRDKVNDLRTPGKIGDYSFWDGSNGYVGYFVLNRDTGVRGRDIGGAGADAVLRAGADAILCDPVTLRKMEVRTSLPGLVFYNGEHLNGRFGKCDGVCLETQFFPDTANRPEFSGTLLMPGQVYDQFTTFRFSW